MRIIVSGSRHWTDVEAIGAALVEHTTPYSPDDVTIVTGGCTGADAIAEFWAELFDFSLKIFPAEWDRFGDAAGPLRNQEMVDAGADLVLAFPLSDSVGTFDLMNRAQAAGIEVVLP